MDAETAVVRGTFWDLADDSNDDLSPGMRGRGRSYSDSVLLMLTEDDRTCANDPVGAAPVDWKRVASLKSVFLDRLGSLKAKGSVEDLKVLTQRMLDGLLQAGVVETRARVVIFKWVNEGLWSSHARNYLPKDKQNTKEVTDLDKASITDAPRPAPDWLTIHAGLTPGVDFNVVSLVKLRCFASLQHIEAAGFPEKLLQDLRDKCREGLLSAGHGAEKVEEMLKAWLPESSERARAAVKAKKSSPDPYLDDSLGKQVDWAKVGQIKARVVQKSKALGQETDTLQQSVEALVAELFEELTAAGLPTDKVPFYSSKWIMQPYTRGKRRDSDSADETSTTVGSSIASISSDDESTDECDEYTEGKRAGAYLALHWGLADPACGYQETEKRALWSDDETRGSAEPDDSFTTLIIRNVGPDATRHDFCELLDQQMFAGMYDFMYQPTNFKQMRSFGYVIVNFTSHVSAACVKRHLQDFAWEHSAEGCPLQAEWSAKQQGREAHVGHFRNQPVMHPDVPDLYKPAIFEGGARIDFPAPTQPLQAPKLLQRQAARDKLLTAVQQALACRA